MDVIRSWRDLESFGIVCLTGEACSLSYRILFDLTAAGKRIVEKWLSLSLESEPWNRGAEDDPHVASIMLSREALVPLAVFALLESGCQEVHAYADRAIGLRAGDLPPPTTGEQKRIFRYHARTGDRNRHQMSGRLI